MNINRYLLEDIEYSEHPSNFEVADGYSVLILRLPEFLEKKLVATSYAFVIEDDKVFIYDRKSKELKELGNIDDMIEFLDTKIEKLIKDIQLYHVKCDSLEEELFEKNLKSNFMEQWLLYKKEISLVQRLTFHASIAYELFVNFQKKQTSKIEHSYTDLLEHIKRVERLSKSALEKLDNLYSFYRAKVDEKMNKNMYILTIISGIFLPLTLITGFFGMNTGGLPYTQDSDGTFKVVILSILIEIAFLAPFLLFNKRA
jgi:magnesium transporter